MLNDNICFWQKYGSISSERYTTDTNSNKLFRLRLRKHFFSGWKQINLALGVLSFIYCLQPILETMMIVFSIHYS